MRYTSAILAFAATVVAQSGPGGAVVEDVPPDSSSGCDLTYNGGQTFTFNTQNVTSGTSKRDIEARQVRQAPAACGGEGALILTLNNGKLLDSKGRTGYIADNRQFQFDGPPQAGAIYTSGWSVCPQGLAGSGYLNLGDNDVFYNCLSGTFNNIYDESQGEQCYEVNIVVQQCATSSSIATTPIAATSGPAPSSTSAENIMSEMNTAILPVTSVAAPAPSAPAAANTTAPVGTASSPATGTAQAPTSSPSPFTGAGAIVAAGQKIVGLVAGVAAYALL